MNQNTRRIAEGGLMIAAAIVLSYFKIQFLHAGSINFCMVPLIVFSVRWGLGWGIATGAVFGALKYFLAGGFAINLASFFLDYFVAYAAVGLAGFMCGRTRKASLPIGALIGCAGRFLIHFISGITIYKIIEPTELFGRTYANATLFSVVYNGSYMLPSTIACFIVCLILSRALPGFFADQRKD